MVVVEEDGRDGEWLSKGGIGTERSKGEGIRKGRKESART